MNEQDLPSDSDVSDEDYNPSGEESNAASEEESDDEIDNDDAHNHDEEDHEHKRKSKKGKQKNAKTVKRKSLKRKPPVEDDIEEKDEIEEKKLKPEEEKKKSDSLWADFLKDCGGPVGKKKTVEDNNSSSNSNGNDKKTNCDKDQISNEKLATATIDEKENKSSVTEIFEFAGEQIRVERQLPANSEVIDNKTNSKPVVSGRGRGGFGAGRGGSRGGGALNSFLNKIGKQSKLSTLEKSKLDWDQFKKSEGIEEDLQTHNKGKDGYLERQDFLERTDLRRFEIEKSLRQKRSGR